MKADQTITPEAVAFWNDKDVQAVVESCVLRAARKLGITDRRRIEGGPELDDMRSVAKIAVLKGLSRYKPGRTKPTTWAYYCSYWALKDYLRSFSTLSYEDRKAGVSEHLTVCKEPDFFADLQTVSHDDDRNRMLHMAIEELSESRRDLINQRFIAGVTAAEYQRKNGLSPRQLQRETALALEDLRRKLELALR